MAHDKTKTQSYYAPIEVEDDEILGSETVDNEVVDKAPRYAWIPPGNPPGPGYYSMEPEYDPLMGNYGDYYPDVDPKKIDINTGKDGCPCDDDKKKKKGKKGREIGKSAGGSSYTGGGGSTPGSPNLPGIPVEPAGGSSGGSTGGGGGGSTGSADCDCKHKDSPIDPNHEVKKPMVQRRKNTHPNPKEKDLRTKGSSGSVKTREVIENPFGSLFSHIESVLDSRRRRGSGLIASTGKFDGLELTNLDDYIKRENEGDYIPSYVNMRDNYSEIGDAIKILLNKAATYKNILNLFNENNIYHNSNVTFIVRTDNAMTALHDRYSSTPLLPDEKEYGNTMVYIKTNGRLKPIQTCTENDLRRFERFEIQISINQDCDYLKASLTLPHELIVHALKFAEIIADNQNFPDVQSKVRKILGENQTVHHAKEFMNGKSNYYKVCKEMLDALQADSNYWSSVVMDRGIFDSIGAVYPEEHSGQVPNHSTYNYLILEIMGAVQHYGISPLYILSLFPYRTFKRGR